METENVKLPFNEWKDQPLREEWRKDFTEREQKEIEFCLLYASQFSHGTVGHNEKLIVAKLATICDALTALAARTEAARMELIMPKWEDSMDSPVEMPQK